MLLYYQVAVFRVYRTRRYSYGKIINIATIFSPIAGAINFCPDQFQARSDEDNVRIGIHEVIHALVRATLGQINIFHKLA